MTVAFGGVLALCEADLTVARGSVTAIIGPNGAGKTTLINAITGMVAPSAGKILLNGREITRLPAWKRPRAGVARTFQNLEICSNMTVLENVLTGAHRLIGYSALDSLLRTPRFLRGEAQARSMALGDLAFVGLAEAADLPAGQLPYGSQRLLELARALALKPDLLLLDEPAAGMNIRETRLLGALIRRIRDERGVTVALIEHDMDLVMDLSDQIAVLNFGAVIATGTPSEIQKNPQVVTAYLGE
ncbi:MAG: ABC transporter ATP-binding protein [Desulfovibrionaceae bacterium]|nr:ABC transporter ATP-binding protein [Desulfovibrionaceae bacterium]